MFLSLPLKKADAAVVAFSGDFFEGEVQTLELAARLVTEGTIAHVIVDEGTSYYGRKVCEFWLPQIGVAPDVLSRFECVYTGESDPAMWAKEIAKRVYPRRYERVLIIAPPISTQRWVSLYSSHLPGTDCSAISGLTRSARMRQFRWKGSSSRKW